MQNVENEIMYYIVQYTKFNRKHNDYEVGEVFKTKASNNPKRRSYLKARFKVRKTKREKRILFIENLHEKIRKSIDKNLPSRQKSIVVFETIDQCLALAKKWNRFDIKPLKIYKVSLTGKLHKCSCTPDEKKENVSKDQHIQGITEYWKGEKDTGLYEWLFYGVGKILEICDNL